MATENQQAGPVALGVDVGGTGIKGALVDTREGILTTERHRVRTPTPATPEAIARTLADIAERFDWRGRMGCTVPARVRRGIVETASNIDTAWIGTDAVDLFQSATGLPATVINDADAAGMAEMHFGAARGQEGTVLVLTFGTGIGSALFVDGHLVPNTELGHLELDGMIFEHRASNVVRKREDLSWARWARRVQKILAHLEFVLAPDLIVIGGGVSRPQRWAKFSSLLQTNCRLAPAKLENEAGLIGAACAAGPTAS